MAVVARSEDAFDLVRDTIGRSVITIKADVLSCDDLQKVAADIKNALGARNAPFADITGHVLLAPATKHNNVRF